MEMLMTNLSTHNACNAFPMFSSSLYSLYLVFCILSRNIFLHLCLFSSVVYVITLSLTFVPHFITYLVLPRPSYSLMLCFDPRP